MTVPLNGLVMAGGVSRRMGADKAALEFAGAKLLDHAAVVLRAAVPEVYVSVRDAQADDELRGQYALINDRFTGIGPAAGILSAHLYDSDAAWLVLACDMPLVSELLLSQLVAARNPAVAATALAGQARGRVEPLCAIYEPVTLAAFHDQVRGGGACSPSDWLKSVAVERVTVPDEDLAGANTQQELQSLRDLAANRKRP